MKPRIIPIILTVLGIAGLIFFMVLPVMTAQARYIDTVSDTDLKVKISVFYNGSGAINVKGTLFGIEDEDYLKVEKGDWALTEEYPEASIYLCAIGLGLAILGMIFSIFGSNATLRIVGAILGLAGAGMAITGCFLMWNFNAEFQTLAADTFEGMELMLAIETTPSYSSFGFGWIATIISTGLIAIGSVFLLIVKPKEIY